MTLAIQIIELAYTMKKCWGPQERATPTPMCTCYQDRHLLLLWHEGAASTSKHVYYQHGCSPLPASQMPSRLPHSCAAPATPVLFAFALLVTLLGALMLPTVDGYTTISSLLPVARVASTMPPLPPSFVASIGYIERIGDSIFMTGEGGDGNLCTVENLIAVI